jgi:chromosome segregation ATPase
MEKKALTDARERIFQLHSRAKEMDAALEMQREMLAASAQREDTLRARVAELEAERDKLKDSVAFYRARCDALQRAQSQMRDPERTVVCDILANGKARGEALR